MKEKIKNLILAVVLLSIFGFLFSNQVFAETAEEIRQKINDRNTEIQKLEQEIKSYQNQISNLGKEANTLKNAIAEIDLTRKKLLTDIKLTENKIAQTTDEINDLSLNIDQKKSDIGKNKEGLSETIKIIENLDSNNILTMLLSKDNFSDFWIEFDNLTDFQKAIKDYVSDLKKNKAILEDDRNEAEDAKKKLEELKSSLDDQHEIVTQNKKEKDKLLSETKNKESNYKKLVAEKEALREQFEKDLLDFESQLKFILDPKTLPGSRVLSWPLKSVYITQQFGKTGDSGRLYASGTHNGIDFRASTGTEVMAMATGVVIGTGDTDIACKGASYGKWILIRYNNGLTSIYGHLSLVKVSEGQSVAVGQTVGYSGNTGYSTGPHLHLSLYASDAVKVSSVPSRACGGKTYLMPVAASNAYLDPLAYLPRI